MKKENIEKMEKYYELVEEYVGKGRCEDAAVNIRHILEIIVDEYVRQYAPEAIYYKLINKIDELEKGEFVDERTIDTFHQLRIISNKGAHGDSETLTIEELEDVIAPLKNEMKKVQNANVGIRRQNKQAEEDSEDGKLYEEWWQACKRAYDKVKYHPMGLPKEMHEPVVNDETIEYAFSKYLENIENDVYRICVSIKLDRISLQPLCYCIESNEQIVYKYDFKDNVEQNNYVMGANQLVEIFSNEVKDAESLPEEYVREQILRKYGWYNALSYIKRNRVVQFEFPKHQVLLGNDNRIKFIGDEKKTIYLAPDIGKEELEVLMNIKTLETFVKQILYYNYRHQGNVNITLDAPRYWENLVCIDIKSTYFVKQSFGYEYIDDETQYIYILSGCESFITSQRTYEIIKKYRVNTKRKKVKEINGLVEARSIDIVDYKDLYEFFLMNKCGHLRAREEEYLHASYETVIGEGVAIVNLLGVLSNTKAKNGVVSPMVKRCLSVIKTIFFWLFIIYVLFLVCCG